MSRAAKVATATTMALFMIAGQAHADTNPERRAARVRYETLQRPHSTTTEVRRTIVAAANRFGVSSSAMLCIANRESNFQERAYNSSSGAAGLFQHLKRYWPSRVRWYNHGVGETLKVKRNASPFAMRANSLVSARMIRTGGYGPWGGYCG